jgi:hypothetical protein
MIARHGVSVFDKVAEQETVGGEARSEEIEIDDSDTADPIPTPSATSPQPPGHRPGAVARARATTVCT